MDSDDECTWIEKQEDAGPGGEALYLLRTGTRKELLSAIKKESAIYNHHKWKEQWQNHQITLDDETFDGDTAISAHVDFSAIYQMKQAVTEKCGHGPSCNQLVGVVLHSPGPQPEGGGKRPVTCDYWRAWSQVKGNAAFHQTWIREIIDHYKFGPRQGTGSGGESGGGVGGRTGPPAVPNLDVVKIKSDGQRSQFLGRKNLGLAAELPHPNVKVDRVDCMCLEDGNKVRMCGIHRCANSLLTVSHERLTLAINRDVGTTWSLGLVWRTNMIFERCTIGTSSTIL